jgi:hypothetical protein
MNLAHAKCADHTLGDHGDGHPDLLFSLASRMLLFGGEKFCHRQQEDHLADEIEF